MLTESKTIVIISVSQQLDAKHDVEGITGLIRGSLPPTVLRKGAAWQHRAPRG